MKAKIKVLVGEGCPFMRVGVAERLIKPQDDLILLDEAENFERIREVYQSQKPELLIVALNQPTTELAERIAMLSESCPELKILIFSPCEDGAFMRATIKAGVKGYVLSSESMPIILSAIHQVAQGHSWISPRIANKLLTPVSLSGRALQVLRLLARGKTDEEISMTLKIAGRTIRYHLDKIYDVLSVESRTRTEAVAVALRLNLL